MSKQDREYIASELQVVIDSLINIKNDLTENEWVGEFVEELTNNSASLARVSFYLGQMQTTQVYERYLPQEIIKDIEKKLSEDPELNVINYESLNYENK